MISGIQDSEIRGCAVKGKSAEVKPISESVFLGSAMNN
jgi:hypothetical protein